MKKIVVIDNYDSFTYNLYQYIAEQYQEVEVVRNDQIQLKEIEELKSSPISLMPDDLTKALEPQDVADLLAWLKNARDIPMQERK